MSIPISNNALSTCPVCIDEEYTNLNKILVVYSTNILSYFLKHLIHFKSVFYRFGRLKLSKPNERIVLVNADLRLYFIVEVCEREFIHTKTVLNNNDNKNNKNEVKGIVMYSCFDYPFYATCFMLCL